MQRQWFYQVLASLLVGLWGVMGAAAQDAERDYPLLTLEHGDLERTYFRYVPESYDPETPTPIVILLHGRTGSGDGMLRLTEFDRVAEEHGFIVLSPNGINAEWNYAKDIPGYSATHDDTDFMLSLVDATAEEFNVDRSRVYIAGLSNGGFMAQRAACDSPDRFAAFASVAASGFGGMLRVCSGEDKPTAPMLLMHGTADNNILWDGNNVSSNGRTVFISYPVPETFAFWAEFNDCSNESETEDIESTGESPETSVRVIRVNCPEHADVELWAVLNGGHNWPGRPGMIPDFVAGNVNEDIQASEVIWAFFERQQLSEMIGDS